MSQRTKEYSSESRGIRFEYDDHWKIRSIDDIDSKTFTIKIASQRESESDPLELVVIEVFEWKSGSLIDLSRRFLQSMDENDKFKNIELHEDKSGAKFGIDVRGLKITNEQGNKKYRYDVYVGSFLDRAVWVYYTAIEEDSSPTSYENYKPEADIIIDSLRFNVKNE